jgi:hypothetical protein
MSARGWRVCFFIFVLLILASGVALEYLIGMGAP